MSGQLASWTAEHSKASWKGRAVLFQLAVAAYPDGCPAGDTTRADLERRTGLGRTTVREGLVEVRELGEVREVGKGGGRSRPTRYAIVVTLCQPDAACWTCGALAKALSKTGRHTTCFSNQKGSPQRRNRSPHDPTTVTRGARAAGHETESQRLARLTAEQTSNELHHVGGEAGDAGGAGGGEPPASTAPPGSEQAPAENPARNGAGATRATRPYSGDDMTAEVAPLDVLALLVAAALGPVEVPPDPGDDQTPPAAPGLFWKPPKGRRLALDGDLADLHAAVDQLQAETVPESYYLKVVGGRAQRRRHRTHRARPKEVSQ